MIYEVSLYDVRKNSFCLIHKNYWKRVTPYKGPMSVYKKTDKGHIAKFIELISN